MFDQRTRGSRTHIPGCMDNAHGYRQLTLLHYGDDFEQYNGCRLCGAMSRFGRRWVHDSLHNSRFRALFSNEAHLLQDTAHEADNF